MKITSGVGEMAGAKQFDAAIASMNKQLGGYAWNAFKRGLTTASDPLFKKQLGERYFTRSLASGGFVIWVFALLFSCGLGSFFKGPLADLVRGRPAMTVGYSYSPFMQPSMRAKSSKLSNIPQYVIPLIAGGLVVVCYGLACRQNYAVVRRFREERILYHSMSRGVKRFGEANGIYAIIVSLVLLPCAPVTGLIMLASLGLSYMAEAEQEEMLWNAYLNKLDDHIESVYMKQAILGQIDTSITSLARPLDESLNPELREDVASASTGGPVQLMAQKPRTAAQKPGVPAKPLAKTQPEAVLPSNSRTETQVRREEVSPKPEQLKANDSLDEKPNRPVQKSWFPRPTTVLCILAVVAVAAIVWPTAPVSGQKPAASKPEVVPQASVSETVNVTPQKAIPSPVAAAVTVAENPAPTQEVIVTPQPLTNPAPIATPSSFPTPVPAEPALPTESQKIEMLYTNLIGVVDIHVSTLSAFSKIIMGGIESTRKNPPKVSRSEKKRILAELDKIESTLRILVPSQGKVLQGCHSDINSAKQNLTHLKSCEQIILPILEELRGQREKVRERLSALNPGLHLF